MNLSVNPIGSDKHIKGRVLDSGYHGSTSGTSILQRTLMTFENIQVLKIPWEVINYLKSIKTTV